ncbi:MAG: Tat pathway signal protein [Planctomycetota bacterium]|nr:Tat pathway signal protein [Planctomycetota bacterium]
MSAKKPVAVTQPAKVRHTRNPAGRAERTRAAQRHCSRREFVKYGSCALAGAAGVLAAEKAQAEEKAGARLLWGNLLHLSFNMWCDREVSAWGPLKGDDLQYVCAQPHLRFDEALWNDLVKRMADAGMNLLVIDLGDGVHYESHPQIAVKNAWSVNRLKDELARLRKLGLEPIPKMNFSTAHDAWLGPYSRRVSTPEYYRVCEDLIAEVSRIFDKPRFFHLGYDEETAENQRQYNYLVVRQHELWWHDFEFFVKQVEKAGVRAWIWSDYAWHHPEEFYKKMPKSVLQSNWYYGMDFKETQREVKAYLDLDKQGYDQIPTASNWATPDNFKATVEFCRKRLDAAHLLGFLQTPWLPTVEMYRERHLKAIELVGEVIAQVR